MTEDQLPIMPSTKVAALLDRYPQLEDVLIGMAPPFRKLKNPILRKSVAKVASLRQAAAVGRLPVEELVNRLRTAVGQQPLAPEDLGDTVSYFAEQPDWFDRAKIVCSIDQRLGGDEDKMPIVTVIQKATRLHCRDPHDSGRTLHAAEVPGLECRDCRQTGHTVPHTRPYHGAAVRKVRDLHQDSCSVWGNQTVLQRVYLPVPFLPNLTLTPPFDILYVYRIFVTKQ